MSLVDKSLLTANRGPLGMRFRQLETVRQYGEARLQGRGGMPASMRRSSTTTSSGQSPRTRASRVRTSCIAPVVHRRMAQRTERVPVGLRGRRRRRRVPPRSATLWWATCGMQLEADRWCELALEVPSAADHPLRPVVLAGALALAHLRGDTTVTGSRSSAAPRNGASEWPPRRGWRRRAEPVERWTCGSHEVCGVAASS